MFLAIMGFPSATEESLTPPSPVRSYFGSIQLEHLISPRKRRLLTEARTTVAADHIPWNRERERLESGGGMLRLGHRRRSRRPSLVGCDCRHGRSFDGLLPDCVQRRRKGLRQHG